MVSSSLRVICPKKETFLHFLSLVTSIKDSSRKQGVSFTFQPLNVSAPKMMHPHHSRGRSIQQSGKHHMQQVYVDKTEMILLLIFIFDDSI